MIRSLLRWAIFTVLLMATIVLSILYADSIGSTILMMLVVYMLGGFAFVAGACAFCGGHSPKSIAGHSYGWIFWNWPRCVLEILE